jgi:hypothetical protein
MCIVSGFAAPPNSSLPRRSDNAVQKISEPKATSNAPRHIKRMACPSDWVPSNCLGGRTRRVAQVCCGVVSSVCGVSTERRSVQALTCAHCRRRNQTSPARAGQHGQSAKRIPRPAGTQHPCHAKSHRKTHAPRTLNDRRHPPASAPRRSVRKPS